jgi:hypothetical protein
LRKFGRPAHPTKKPGASRAFDARDDPGRRGLVSQDLVGSTGWPAGSLTGTGVIGSETGTLLI